MDYRPLALFLASALSLSAVAAPIDDLPDADPQLKLLVDKVTDGKATASKWFEGPSNLIGVIVSNPSNPDSPGIVAWATPDKKHLFFGQLMDRQKRNLTALSAEHFRVIEPTISLSKINVDDKDNVFNDENLKENMVAILSFISKQGNAVAKGTGTRSMFVFVDPHCPYCKALQHELNTHPELTKDITVYYLPVFLSEANIVPAAQILEGGADVMEKIYNGTAGKLPEPSDDSKTRVAMNNALLARITEIANFGSFATPSIVVQQDGKPNVYQGTVKKENFAAFLNSVQKPTLPKTGAFPALQEDAESKAN